MIIQAFLQVREATAVRDSRSVQCASLATAVEGITYYSGFRVPPSAEGLVFLHTTSPLWLQQRFLEQEDASYVGPSKGDSSAIQERLDPCRMCVELATLLQSEV